MAVLVTAKRRTSANAHQHSTHFAHPRPWAPQNTPRTCRPVHVKRHLRRDPSPKERIEMRTVPAGSHCCFFEDAGICLCCIHRTISRRLNKKLGPAAASGERPGWPEGEGMRLHFHSTCSPTIYFFVSLLRRTPTEINQKATFTYRPVIDDRR